MKKLFVIDFSKKTITATKATLKRASVFNSPEYKELMELVNQLPDFAIVEKKVKKSEGKKTYEGLNKELMKQYISIQDNAEELERQFAKAAELGKFPLVRKWFLNTFEGFDMDEAKEAIDQALLAKVSETSAESKCEVVAMPKAENF